MLEPPKHKTHEAHTQKCSRNTTCNWLFDSVLIHEFSGGKRISLRSQQAHSVFVRLDWCLAFFTVVLNISIKENNEDVGRLV